MSPFSLSGDVLLLNMIEQFEDVHAKRVGDNFDGVERRIRISGLNSTQVGLIEPTLFPKDNLAHTCRKPQRAHAGTKLLSQCFFHTGEYLGYALIHIHTNSYKGVRSSGLNGVTLSSRHAPDAGNQSRLMVSPFTNFGSEQIVAVAIEFLNMIIPVAEIEKKYPGGWEKCREDTGCDLPGSPSWSDGDLLRIGTMDEMTLQLMGDAWVSMGFKGFTGRGDKRRWKNFCQFGSTGPAFCDWLSFDNENGTVSLVKTPIESSLPLEKKFPALGQYRLQGNQASSFDKCFELVLPNFRLSKEDLDHPLLGAARDVPGVYFFVMCSGECRYKIYAGKTKSIRRRLNEYSSEFQVHAPNDYKLRFFQEFILKHGPQTTFDLYFQKSDIDSYTKMETAVIREYRPFINLPSHAVSEERNVMKEAFADFSMRIFERRLTKHA